MATFVLHNFHNTLHISTTNILVISFRATFETNTSPIRFQFDLYFRTFLVQIDQTQSQSSTSNKTLKQIQIISNQLNIKKSYFCSLHASSNIYAY